MVPALTREAIAQRGGEPGLDLIGLAPTGSPENKVPERYRPSRIAAHMKSLVVLARG